jgi:hypothetical protein
MNNQARRIPTLFTLDVHDQPGIGSYIEHSVQFLSDMGIPATYFVPAQVFEKFPKQINKIPRPHQVACHGLFHTGEEDYSGMPCTMQRDYIERATKILSDGLSRHPGAFRTPGFRISGTTLSLLAEYGYYADVSVNSGRLGITSTYNKENGWFLAPRLPYHPDSLNPFREGSLPIWEIPVSAIVLPFTSNVAVTLGSGLTKLLTAVLLEESRLRPKPLVYMSHPEDLSENGPEHKRPKFNIRMLIPSERGIPFRHYLGAKGPEEFYQINCEILKYLQCKNAVEFLTLEDYVKRHLQQGSPDSQGTLRVSPKQTDGLR